MSRFDNSTRYGEQNLGLTLGSGYARRSISRQELATIQCKKLRGTRAVRALHLFYYDVSVMRDVLKIARAAEGRIRYELLQTVEDSGACAAAAITRSVSKIPGS